MLVAKSARTEKQRNNAEVNFFITDVVRVSWSRSSRRDNARSINPQIAIVLHQRAPPLASIDAELSY